MHFDHETHRYTHEGKIIPSVTQIIPRPEFYCTPEQLENARLDGVENHAMVKLYFDTGDMYGDPYLVAFDKWLQENGSLLGDLLVYEEHLFSPTHFFAGTPDMVFEKAIVDLKRNFNHTKIHSLQLAGYHILSRAHTLKKTKTWIIVWEQNGKFKSRNVYDPRAEEIFLACLQKFKLEQAIESYMKST